MIWILLLCFLAVVLSALSWLNSPIEIREQLTKDDAQVSRLVVADGPVPAWGALWLKAQTYRACADRGAVSFVALRGATVVGHVSAIPFQTDTPTPRLFVQLTGKPLDALISSLLAWCREQGVDEVRYTGDVGSKEVAALTAAGFAPEGRGIKAEANRVTLVKGVTR